MLHHTLKHITTLALLSLLAVGSNVASGQKSDEKKHLFRDTLDHKLDFSSFILDAHGFLPVAMIITEPALGNIGLALAPMFMKQKTSKDPKQYVPPDITMAMGMYTANKSWGVGGAHIGSFPNAGIKYRFGLLYGDVNLNFYRTILGQEFKYDFNIRSIPVFGSISKKVTRNDMYLGIKYLFMRTRLSPNFSGNIPSFIKDKELKNNTASLGVFYDWDKRNTIFTPDKGYRINVEYGVNANWTGSDFDYQRLNATATWFLPIKPNWISGLRLAGQHVFDDPPFYLLPGIDMRGIPAARYQGASTILLETEQRYDFNMRWSALAFGGVAKAVPKDVSFGEAKMLYNAGVGFRYLLARVFKIRAGVDVAVGPGSWGYYIVFGHNWNR